MKTKLLLTSLFFLFITNSIFSQIVNIPDVNFKAYLVGNALINTNNDTEIQVTEAAAFTGQIVCENISISDLTGLESFTSISILNLTNNGIAALDISNNVNLTNLGVTDNPIVNLNITNNQNLLVLALKGTDLTALDLSSGNSLTQVFIHENQLLEYINFKIIDYSNIGTNFYCFNHPNLHSICVTDTELAPLLFTNVLDSIVYTEYCNYLPSNSNIIAGTILYDFNNDGCDGTDLKAMNIEVNTTSMGTVNTSYSVTDGTYNIYTINNNSTITEVIPNLPSYFTVTPTTQVSTFPDNYGNTATVDFCITANSIVNDVEVYAYSISLSRPGFDNTVRVFYKNNGTATISGALTLDFNELQEVFNNASITPVSTTINSLTWNYNNLLPFETRSIDVNFTINTPVDQTNPVNGGDILNYSTGITPTVGDVNTLNNSHTFSVIVVNAYDPNDIICFQGDKISETQVIDDLVYRVRFQNTGTASAVNVVVKTFLDEDLDISTFEPIMASHNYRTQLTSTNKVEFIFENIQLQDSLTNEPESHGWVFYKIKPKSNAVIGDDFDATANIYFDFNAPVITNTYNTAVSTETSIPDDNFELALMNSGLDRGMPNNKVFTGNINIITELNVSNKNIQDLTGIQDFTALTSLNVSNNQLTVLDVSSLVSLNDFDAQFNLLSSLNIKNGNNTNFTQFKTLNNPNLTCIFVDNPTYSTANWSEIDANSIFANDLLECSTLHTENSTVQKFVLYPNPTNNKVYIDIPEQSDLIIYSVLGREISRRNLIIGKNEISVAGLPKGIYLFKLNSKDKTSTSKVVIY